MYIVRNSLVIEVDESSKEPKCRYHSPELKGFHGEGKGWVGAIVTAGREMEAWVKKLEAEGKKVPRRNQDATIMLRTWKK